MKEQLEHPVVVERVQTGVRMEKRLLKVLKGLAELKDMTLGDLLEGIVLHAFEGKAPFSDNTLKEIEKLRFFICFYFNPVMDVGAIKA